MKKIKKELIESKSCESRPYFDYDRDYVGSNKIGIIGFPSRKMDK